MQHDQTEPLFTDLCSALHLLSLDVKGAEGLHKVSDPGSDALGLGSKPVALPLQVTPGLGPFLQPGLQVSVALNQVIAVLQEALGSDALSAYRRQQIAEGLDSTAVTRRETRSEKRIT